MTKRCVLRVAAQAALVASIGVGFAATGSAHSTGVNGRSGKTNGAYCRGCHAGGTDPTVAFDGPAAMDPGSIATFRFTVTSHSADQIAAGLDVAASAGSLGLVAEQGTYLLIREVTHVGPKANDGGGQAAFEFTWQAPASAGIYTLYGAGASVNGNFAGNGDASARTTYEIVVGAVVPTPTATNAPLPVTPTPTRTASGEPCVGDCGSDGEVTVEELVRGVNIALGVAPLSVCPVFDSNDDGEATVDELVQAVNNALSGCPVQ